MAEKKRPPDIPPLSNIIPPNEEHDYFKDCHNHPFEFESPHEFKKVNAWWLAEAALLAYAEESFATECFHNAGLSDVEFFSGNSTQCYVAHNDDFVIVAFRGTEISEREGTGGRGVGHIGEDLWVDLRIDLVDSGQGGFVHQGFKGALDKVWNRLKSYLDEVSDEDGRQRPVWFTGHSLGGALATLAADRYDSAAGLYTFGSPRVGDHAFASDFRPNTYRFVNNDDVITKVPMFGSYPHSSVVPGLPSIGRYAHVGNMKYISNRDSEAIIVDDPSLWTRSRDNLSRVVGNTFNLPPLISRGDLPENALTDHAPIYYVVHIWNDYDP